MRELKRYRLNDPGEPHDGIYVVICEAKRTVDDNGVTKELCKHTCVRDDNTVPPGGKFEKDWSSLPDVDVDLAGLSAYEAWVFRGAPSLGEITGEQRLRILLGQKLRIGPWVISAR